MATEGATYVVSRGLGSTDDVAAAVSSSSAGKDIPRSMTSTTPAPDVRCVAGLEAQMPRNENVLGPVGYHPDTRLLTS